MHTRERDRIQPMVEREDQALLELQALCKRHPETLGNPQHSTGAKLAEALILQEHMSVGSIRKDLARHELAIAGLEAELKEAGI